MAIDHSPYPEATNLAHPNKGFYPLRIPLSHWQLHHYISTPEPDLLFYASGSEIYCVNTTTKKRKHIATLPFEARCTASGHGYVCVAGDEDGHFAAIKLDGSGPRTLDVDSALPIERQPWRTRDGGGIGRRAATVRVERIGEEIVNSISIHRIQDEEAHLDDIVAVLTNNDKTVRVYSLPQSLETTVLDLPFAMNHAAISPDTQTLIAVGDFNQAYFFRREIVETPPQIPKPHNRLNSAAIEWTLTNVINLHVSDVDPTAGYFTTAWSPSGHLVAVGSEGGYLTVIDMEILQSAEYEGEDAVVAIVPGTRADMAMPSHPGAIRSMMFSPEPWDLLVWAEDQGRVCIGDLRTGLKSRQIIHLEPQGDDLRLIPLEDVPSDLDSGSAFAGGPGTGGIARDIDELEADFIRRYRHAPDNAAAVNFATEYIEARRRQRQQRQDTAGSRSQTATPGVDPALRSLRTDPPPGLTPQEQQMLDSLRTTRQREEARSRGEIPRSVNYTTPDMFSTSNRVSSSLANAGDTSSTSARPGSEVLSLDAAPNSLPELPPFSNASTRHSSSDLMDQISSSVRSLQEAAYAQVNASGGLLRRSDGSRLPRRRQSVTLTSSGNIPTPATSPPPRQQGNLPRASASTEGVWPQHEPEENPWRVIEEHMTLARGPLFERAQQTASPLPEYANETARSSDQDLQAELAAERARIRSLARQRERWRSLRIDGRSASPGAGGSGSTQDAARLARLATFPEGYEALQRRSQLRGAGSLMGVRTAGLAMSPDGRLLWAACEEGIFEMDININARMFWPSVELR